MQERSPARYSLAMGVVVADRGIIFSAPMVLKLLAGEKTQTRRVVTNKTALDWLAPGNFTPEFVAEPDNHLCPYGIPGDRLYVRETWYDDNGLRHTEPKPTAPDRFIEYRADHDCRNWEAGCPCNDDAGRSSWRPAIHMPKWAARIWLEITDVRVQRVQEISEGDARAEGIGVAERRWTAPGETPSKICVNCRESRDVHIGTLRACRWIGGGQTFSTLTYRSGFAWLWQSINGKRPGCSWDANPWCWALTFRRTPAPAPAGGASGGEG